MNRFATVLLCLGLSAFPAFTQTAAPAGLPAAATFAVHEDKLGESFSDWKARTQYPFVIKCVDERDGTVSCTRTTRRTSSGPVTADTIRASKEFAAAQDEESKHPLTVGGMYVLGEIHSKFFKEALYKVSFRAGGSATGGGFTQLLDAHTANYGVAGEASDVNYQNGYGATYIGHRFKWTDTLRQCSLVVDLVPGGRDGILPCRCDYVGHKR